MIWDSKDAFLEQVYRRSKSINSLRYYRFGVEDFKRFCDGARIKDVNKRNVYSVLDDYVASLDKKGLKPKTIKDSVSAVRRFLVFNDIEIDSAKFRTKVTMPRVSKIADEPLTLDVVRALLTRGRPDSKMSALILTLLSSGMRIGEALSLRWKDVDLKSEPVRLNLKAEYTKQREARIAYASEEAREALREIERAPDDYVFPYAGNIWQREKEAGHTFLKVVKRAGLDEKIEGHRIHKIHFHTFRKYVLTKAVDLLGEHAGHALIGHSYYMDTYYKKTEEERAADYLRLQPKLTVFRNPEVDPDAVKREAALEAMRAVATSFGIDPMKVRIEKQREVGREVTGEEEIELIRTEIRKLRGAQGDPNMIVREEELDAYLSRGWQFVSVLPSKRILIRK